MSPLRTFFREMRRRKLFRAAVAYVVVAWLLVEVASVVLPIFETPEWVLQAFTFLMILGFPLAIVLAWTFEVTPEGIRREATDAGAIETSALQDEQSGESDKTIVVLPFADLSDDGTNAYFSEGLTDEINNKLSRIGRLKVASRTSAKRYRGLELDVREIGAQLGVRYVLEGSVRKAADRVRTSVQLVDSKNGFSLWAEDFDGTMDDIFGIQEAVALRIASALDLNISPDERRQIEHRYTENSRAFDAYLEGQALVQYTDSLEKLNAAKRHFDRSLSLDPNYAPALAGLASVQVHIYRNFDPDDSHLAEARALAKRALENGKGLARAHVAAGEVSAAEYRYGEAAERFREALQIDDSDAWTWDALSWVLGYLQPPDAEGAERAARTAIRIQPQFSVAYYHLGRALTLQKRFDEALDAFDHVGKLSTDNRFTQYGRALVYLESGEFRRALEAHQAAGLTGSASRLQLVSILAELGDHDRALSELKAAFDEGFKDYDALRNDPHLASLRTDPRYTALLEQYG